MYWKDRVGEPTWNMHYAFRGHMVVLVDQNTASDGEAFADGFRRLGLGTTIGMRTWGGSIGIEPHQPLVDSSRVFIRSFADDTRYYPVLIEEASTQADPVSFAALYPDAAELVRNDVLGPNKLQFPLPPPPKPEEKEHKPRLKF